MFHCNIFCIACEVNSRVFEDGICWASGWQRVICIRYLVYADCCWRITWQYLFLLLWRYERRGWVTFSYEVDIKDICSHLMEVKVCGICSLLCMVSFVCLLPFNNLISSSYVSSLPNLVPSPLFLPCMFLSFPLSYYMYLFFTLMVAFIPTHSYLLLFLPVTSLPFLSLSLSLLFLFPCSISSLALSLFPLQGERHPA